MIHEVVPVGPLRCNCHLLADEGTGEAVIVDPGDDADEVLARAKGFVVKAILHTHCHFDHMTGTRAVKEATGAPILIHRADQPLYEALARQYRMFGMGAGGVPSPLPVDGFLEEGQTVAFGRHALTVLHTPGHTPGSCCFHMEGQVFAGDTLFRRSVGRTDLPGGDEAQEHESIRTKLYTLDPGTVVWPGHGDRTRVGEEKEKNPFVRG